MATEGGGKPETAAATVVPPSIPSGDQTIWADATPLLDAACADLQDGELIHGDNFSLFAAMSALEIMDPKMDSGMKSSGYRSIEEAIESGAAPVPLSTNRTLDIQRTLDVMDHLLACEATWHKGHPLAQTLFSCIYLLQIERTSSHALLHSYCGITRAICNVVISTVSEVRTHEEEDIFTSAYGLPLKGDGEDRFLSIINSVEETLSRQLRACRAPPAKEKLYEELEPLQDNVDLEEGFCKATLCRIRFRKYFYHVFMCLAKPQGRGMELARKHISSCLSELAGVRNSSEFLQTKAYGNGSHKDDSVDRTTASGCKPVGFDVNLNSRFSAPTPPRAIKILGWIEAIEYFEKLLHDLDIICSFSMDPLLEGVLRFVVHFQKTKPDLVARSYLQRLLVQDGKLYGRESFYDVIVRTLGLPDVSRSQEFLAYYNNEVVAQLRQLVINLLRILCTNAAWQRRKLGKVLQDWSLVSLELELSLSKDKEFGEISSVLIDENQYARVSKHIAIWEQEQTYWIASRFLMLGFELELYSPSEYCMVYWYMYVVFVKHLEMAQLRKTSDTIRPHRKGKKKKDLSKDAAKDARFSSSILLLQCYICLSEGLAMMMAALANEHKVFQLPSTFNSERERFMQHFDLLLKAHIPGNISYHFFKESTSHICISNTIKYDYFKDAQRICAMLRESSPNDPEKLAELRQMELVAEYNIIALHVINRVGTQDSSLKISFDFRHHPCFAVAVVKRS